MLSDPRRIFIFSPMSRVNEKAWARGGAAVSLGVSALAYLLGRRWAGRIALGFAVAFLERLREARLAARVHSLLARSGREP
jgi:hypothetical protein